VSNFKAWAKDVALRAVKTAAQAAGAVITANTAGLTHVPFGTVADVAGLAALICVLQNLSNLKVPDPAVPVPFATPVATTMSSTSGYSRSGQLEPPTAVQPPVAPPPVASDFIQSAPSP